MCSWTRTSVAESRERQGVRMFYFGQDGCSKFSSSTLRIPASTRLRLARSGCEVTTGPCLVRSRPSKEGKASRTQDWVGYHSDDLDRTSGVLAQGAHEAWITNWGHRSHSSSSSSSRSTRRVSERKASVPCFACANWSGDLVNYFFVFHPYVCSCFFVGPLFLQRCQKGSQGSVCRVRGVQRNEKTRDHLSRGMFRIYMKDMRVVEAEEHRLFVL